MFIYPWDNNKSPFHWFSFLGRQFTYPFADSEDCKQCPRVLAEVEHIDDDADKAGIDFVKIDDKQMAKEFGVFALPAIVFFKPSSKEPVIYAGLLFSPSSSL